MLDLPFEAAQARRAVRRREDDPDPRQHDDRLPRGGPPRRRQRRPDCPILVSQNFYRHGDRFREENGEKFDKFITDEFVVHTVYGCQVVVTNPTSSRQKLTVLLQLPVGAIPVANGQFTRSVPLDLEPYHTQTIDYFFYFPKAGKFPHFPVHVAQERAVRRRRRRRPRSTSSRSRRRLDTTSWDYVSQHGTNDDVLAFLNRENVRALNLDKIAFRMKDRGVLRDRHAAAPRAPPVPPDAVVVRRPPRRRADRPAVPAARRSRSSPSAAGRSQARS